MTVLNVVQSFITQHRKELRTHSTICNGRGSEEPMLESNNFMSAPIAGEKVIEALVKERETRS